MGMIAKNVKTDINVIALVGERGREVLEFVQKDLGEEGMKRSVLVVATSDQPAMLRMKCPLVATTHSGIFQGSGFRCPSYDGFPYTLRHGTKRDWAGYRGTADCQRIYTFHLCGVSEAIGAERQFQPGFHNGGIYGPGGGR
mgnify:CR=1 FL=1